MDLSNYNMNQSNSIIATKYAVEILNIFKPNLFSLNADTMLHVLNAEYNVAALANEVSSLIFNSKQYKLLAYHRTINTINLNTELKYAAGFESI